MNLILLRLKQLDLLPSGELRFNWRGYHQANSILTLFFRLDYEFTTRYKPQSAEYRPFKLILNLEKCCHLKLCMYHYIYTCSFYSQYLLLKSEMLKILKTRSGKRYKRVIFKRKNNEKNILKKQKEKGKVYGTWYSQAVTHPSTDQARRCLTSVIGREPVFST